MILPRSQSAPARLVRRGEELGDRLGGASARRTAVILVAGYVVVVAVLVSLGTLMTRVGPFDRWDRAATQWLSDHRLDWLGTASDIASRSADTLGVLALASIVVVVLAVRHRWWQIGVLVAALALELTVFLLVNFAVDRPRPNVPRLGSTPSTSSFPSGHSAATVALYGSVAVFVYLASGRRAVRLVAVLTAVVVPLAVGGARVYRGMHNPLDVLFGYGMGAAVITVAIVAVSAGHGTPSGSDEPPSPHADTGEGRVSADSNRSVVGTVGLR